MRTGKRSANQGWNGGGSWCNIFSYGTSGTGGNGGASDFVNSNATTTGNAGIGRFKCWNLVQMFNNRFLAHFILAGGGGGTQGSAGASPSMVLVVLEVVVVVLILVLQVQMEAAGSANTGGRWRWSGTDCFWRTQLLVVLVVQD